MNTEEIHKMFNLVCDTPGESTFQIEYMPDLLLNSQIDDSKPHVHTFYEILWFQEGEGVHTLDFRDYEVVPNTIFFISPGQVHNFDSKRDYKGVTIKLCNDFMKEYYGDNQTTLKYDMFNAQGAPYYIKEDIAEELKKIIEEMKNEVKDEKAFAQIDMLRALTTLFLIKIYRNYDHIGSTPLNSLKSSHRLFMQFRQLVEAEFTRIHTVQDYAAKMNVAIRTLNKAVTDSTGIAPLTFINNRIMLEAKRQIRYTNQMMKEIAFNLGFEDPSYFVKFFKREAGVLPTQFREKNNDSVCKTN